LTHSPRRRPAAFITAAVLFAATALFAGCSSGGSSGAQGDAPAAQGRIVALLVDQTCDATPALTELSAKALDAAVSAAAKSSGTFLGEAITTDEYQTGTFSVSKNFTSDRANDASVARDLDEQAAEYRVSDEARSLAKGPKPNTACGSDLLNAVSAAERAFAQTPGAKDRAKDLVFVTNGLVIDEKKGGTNFVFDRITPAYVSKLIAKQKAKGLFPDLTGVNVYLVGLGVSDQDVPPEQVKAIEGFWSTLASKAGAKSVVAVRSGSQIALAQGGGE
jgi:hypothetical protein